MFQIWILCYALADISRQSLPPRDFRPHISIVGRKLWRARSLGLVLNVDKYVPKFSHFSERGNIFVQEHQYFAPLAHKPAYIFLVGDRLFILIACVGYCKQKGWSCAHLVGAVMIVEGDLNTIDAPFFVFRLHTIYIIVDAIQIECNGNM